MVNSLTSLFTYLLMTLATHNPVLIAYHFGSIMQNTHTVTYTHCSGTQEQCVCMTVCVFCIITHNYVHSEYMYWTIVSVDSKRWSR